MEVIALCGVCLACGLVVGFEWGCKWKEKNNAAPIQITCTDEIVDPIDESPLLYKPIKGEWEPIEVNGKTLYRLH